MSTKTNKKQNARAVETTKKFAIKALENIAPEEPELKNPYQPDLRRPRAFHHIPTPPITEIPDYDRRAYQPYRLPAHYIKYHQNSGSLSNNIGVQYDLLRRDIQQIANLQNKYMSLSVPLTELQYAQCIEVWEKHLFDNSYPDYEVDPPSNPRYSLPEFILLAKKVVNATGTEYDKIIKDWLNYWISRRNELKRALIRAFQKPTSRDEPSNAMAFRPRSSPKRSSRGNKKGDQQTLDRLLTIRLQLLYAYHLTETVRVREVYTQQRQLTHTELSYMDLKDSNFYQTMIAASTAPTGSTPALDEYAQVHPPEGITLLDDFHETEVPNTIHKLKQLFKNVLPYPTFGTPEGNATLPQIQIGRSIFQAPIQQTLPHLVHTNVVSSATASHADHKPHHGNQYTSGIHHKQPSVSPQFEMQRKIYELFDKNDLGPGVNEYCESATYPLLQTAEDELLIHSHFQQQMVDARIKLTDYYSKLSQQRVKRQQVLLDLYLKHGKHQQLPADVNLGTISTAEFTNKMLNQDGETMEGPISPQDLVQLAQLDANIFDLQKHSFETHRDYQYYVQTYYKQRESIEDGTVDTVRVEIDELLQHKFTYKKPYSPFISQAEMKELENAPQNTNVPVSHPNFDPNPSYIPNPYLNYNTTQPSMFDDGEEDVYHGNLDDIDEEDSSTKPYRGGKKGAKDDHTLEPEDDDEEYSLPISCGKPGYGAGMCGGRRFQKYDYSADNCHDSDNSMNDDEKQPKFTSKLTKYTPEEALNDPIYTQTHVYVAPEYKRALQPHNQHIKVRPETEKMTKIKTQFINNKYNPKKALVDLLGRFTGVDRSRFQSVEHYVPTQFITPPREVIPNISIKDLEHGKIDSNTDILVYQQQRTDPTTINGQQQLITRNVWSSNMPDSFYSAFNPGNAMVSEDGNFLVPPGTTPGGITHIATVTQLSSIPDHHQRVDFIIKQYYKYHLFKTHLLRIQRICQRNFRYCTDVYRAIISLQVVIEQFKECGYDIKKPQEYQKLLKNLNKLRVVQKTYLEQDITFKLMREVLEHFKLNGVEADLEKVGAEMDKFIQYGDKLGKNDMYISDDSSTVSSQPKTPVKRGRGNSKKNKAAPLAANMNDMVDSSDGHDGEEKEKASIFPHLDNFLRFTQFLPHDPQDVVDKLLQFTEYLQKRDSSTHHEPNVCPEAPSANVNVNGPELSSAEQAYIEHIADKIIPTVKQANLQTDNTPLSTTKSSFEAVYERLKLVMDKDAELMSLQTRLDLVGDVTDENSLNNKSTSKKAAIVPTKNNNGVDLSLLIQGIQRLTQKDGTKSLAPPHITSHKDGSEQNVQYKLQLKKANDWLDMSPFADDDEGEKFVDLSPSSTVPVVKYQANHDLNLTHSDLAYILDDTRKSHYASQSSRVYTTIGSTDITIPDVNKMYNPFVEEKLAKMQKSCQNGEKFAEKKDVGGSSTTTTTTTTTTVSQGAPTTGRFIKTEDSVKVGEKKHIPLDLSISYDQDHPLHHLTDIIVQQQQQAKNRDENGIPPRDEDTLLNMTQDEYYHLYILPDHVKALQYESDFDYSRLMKQYDMDEKTPYNLISHDRQMSDNNTSGTMHGSYINPIQTFHPQLNMERLNKITRLATHSAKLLTELPKKIDKFYLEFKSRGLLYPRDEETIEKSAVDVVDNTTMTDLIKSTIAPPEAPTKHKLEESVDQLYGYISNLYDKRDITTFNNAEEYRASEKIWYGMSKALLLTNMGNPQREFPRFYVDSPAPPPSIFTLKDDIEITEGVKNSAKIAENTPTLTSVTDATTMKVSTIVKKLEESVSDHVKKQKKLYYDDRMIGLLHNNASTWEELERQSISPDEAPQITMKNVTGTTTPIDDFTIFNQAVAGRRPQLSLRSAQSRGPELMTLSKQDYHAFFNDPVFFTLHYYDVTKPLQNESRSTSYNPTIYETYQMAKTQLAEENEPLDASKDVNSSSTSTSSSQHPKLKISDIAMQNLSAPPSAKNTPTQFSWIPQIARNRPLQRREDETDPERLTSLLQKLPLPHHSAKLHPILSTTNSTYPVNPLIIQQRFEMSDIKLNEQFCRYFNFYYEQLTKSYTVQVQKLYKVQHELQQAKAAGASAQEVDKLKSTLQITYVSADYLALQWFCYLHLQQHLSGLSSYWQLPMVDELLAHYTALYHKMTPNIRAGQYIGIVHSLAQANSYIGQEHELYVHEYGVKGDVILPSSFQPSPPPAPPAPPAPPPPAPSAPSAPTLPPPVPPVSTGPPAIPTALPGPASNPLPPPLPIPPPALPLPPLSSMAMPIISPPPLSAPPALPQPAATENSATTTTTTSATVANKDTTPIHSNYVAVSTMKQLSRVTNVTSASTTVANGESSQQDRDIADITHLSSLNTIHNAYTTRSMGPKPSSTPADHVAFAKFRFGVIGQVAQQMMFGTRQTKLLPYNDLVSQMALNYVPTPVSIPAGGPPDPSRTNIIAPTTNPNALQRPENILQTLRVVTLLQHATEYCNMLQTLGYFLRIKITPSQGEEAIQHEELNKRIKQKIAEDNKDLEMLKHQGINAQSFVSKDDKVPFLPPDDPYDIALQFLILPENHNQINEVQKNHFKQLFAGHLVPRIGRGDREVLDVINYGTAKSLPIRRMDVSMVSDIANNISKRVHKDLLDRYAAHKEKMEKEAQQQLLQQNSAAVPAVPPPIPTTFPQLQQPASLPTVQPPPGQMPLVAPPLLPALPQQPPHQQ